MNQGEIVRLQDMGLTRTTARALMAAEVQLPMSGNTQAARTAAGRADAGAPRRDHRRATGLDEELEMIREQFRRYAIDKVEPMRMTGTSRTS
jgi:(2S)-methylsuccinyl-CoA dehydrogenase